MKKSDGKKDYMQGVRDLTERIAVEAKTLKSLEANLEKVVADKTRAEAARRDCAYAALTQEDAETLKRLESAEEILAKSDQRVRSVEIALESSRQKLEGLRVVIIGDIAHSRVARSNVHLLSKFGVDIVLCGPAPLLPADLQRIAPGVSLTYDIRAAIRDADVIMMLRVQLERQHEAAFPAGEYFPFYGLRLEHIELAKPDVIVMHPGPINRGRELSSEVADSQRSVILNQVENGIAVRMAVLERIIGEQNPD